MQGLDPHAYFEPFIHCDSLLMNTNGHLERPRGVNPSITHWCAVNASACSDGHVSESERERLVEAYLPKVCVCMCMCVCMSKYGSHHASEI